VVVEDADLPATARPENASRWTSVHGHEYRPVPYRPERMPEPESVRKHYYVDESVGIAVGMLLTALHLAGLAALTRTLSPMKFLSEVLDRTRNEKAFAVIPVGYPAADCEVPDLLRKTLDQVLIRR
jgi:nitroreductase